VFNLTIQGQIFILVPVIIAFIVLMINYRKITKSKKSYLNLFAWVLRLCVVIMTIFILADPYLHFTRTKEKLPGASLFIDTSSSMAYNTSDLSEHVSQRVDELIDWIRDRSDHLSLFEFNSSVNPIQQVEDIQYEHSLTDFSEIPSAVNSVGSKINFIITDGIATAGPDPSSIKLRANQTMHVIAAENKASWKDISIEKMDYPVTVIQGDTVTITTIIRVQTIEDIRTDLQVHDQSGKILSTLPVIAEAGDGISEITFKVAVHQNQIPELISITPVDGEENILNNKYSIHLNVLSESEHILLVTGALSPNTSLIKEILNSVPRSDVGHFFRIGGPTWNQPVNTFLTEQPKLIVLDNFPVLNEDRNLFDRLIRSAGENGIPIIFFEGANSGLLTSTLVSQLSKIRVEPVRIISPLSISITDFGERYFDRLHADNLSPTSTIHQWKTDQLHTDLLVYTDGSAAISKVELPFTFFGVFIPELSKLNFKLGQTNSPDLLRDGLKNIFLSSIYSGSDLITSQMDKLSYDLGEIVNVKGIYNDDYVSKPDRMNFQIQTETGEVVQEIPAVFDVDSQEFKGNFFVNKSGSMQVTTKSVWDNGNEFTSTPLEFVVQDVVVEDRDLQMNRNSLLELSLNNRGEFFTLDDLEKVYNSLEFVPEKNIESYRLSTISTHKWWWVIIILLSVEWIIRKRIGLL